MKQFCLNIAEVSYTTLYTTLLSNNSRTQTETKHKPSISFQAE